MCLTRVCDLKGLSVVAGVYVEPGVCLGRQCVLVLESVFPWVLTTSHPMLLGLELVSSKFLP